MSTIPDEPARVSRRRALLAGAAWVATLGALGPETAQDLARLARGRPMTGARLATILRDERMGWSALLAEVGAERMEIAGAAGEWSVKELVAHLTWYERAVLDGARQVLSGKEFTRPADQGEMAGLTLDERNAHIASRVRTRPASDVLAQADAVFGQLLTAISACPDRLLNDASALGLPEDIPPWMRVANNSYSHYREHATDLRAWLAATPAR